MYLSDNIFFQSLLQRESSSFVQFPLLFLFPENVDVFHQKIFDHRFIGIVQLKQDKYKVEAKKWSWAGAPWSRGLVSAY